MFSRSAIRYAQNGRFRGGLLDGRRRGGAWRFRGNLWGGLDGYKGGGVAWLLNKFYAVSVPIPGRNTGGKCGGG